MSHQSLMSTMLIAPSSGAIHLIMAEEPEQQTSPLDSMNKNSSPKTCNWSMLGHSTFPVVFPGKSV